MAESTEHKSIGELFQESMHRHFTKHGAGPIPGSQAVSTDTDIYVNRWDEDEERVKALTLEAGTFLLMEDPDIPGSMSAIIDRRVGEAGSAIYLYSMAITEFPDDSELETVTEKAEDGTEVRHIKGRADGQPVQFKMSVEPVAPKGGRPISLLEAYLWAMVGDVAQEGDEEFTNAIAREALAMAMHEESLNPWPPEPRKPEQPNQRPRKKECTNKSTVTTNTKVESAIFGGLAEDKKLTAEDYDGREIGIQLGKLGTSYLRLIDYNPKDQNAAEIERTESRLQDNERFWLTQLQSVVCDNPGETHIYGTDILKKAGYKKPLRPDHAATMIEAAEAIKTLTNISTWLDTTEENARYERDGSRVVERFTDRKIVRGEVSIERYEDGTVDFCVDLLPLEGQDVTTALPLYEYARSKGELMTADQGMFEFTGCGTVTVQHRQIMLYIYRHINSKLSHSDTVLFETMFKKLGIEVTKDSRYRLKNKIEKMLNWWKKEKYIESWSFKYKGRACVGVTVKRKKQTR